MSVGSFNDARARRARQTGRAIPVKRPELSGREYVEPTALGEDRHPVGVREQVRDHQSVPACNVVENCNGQLRAESPGVGRSGLPSCEGAADPGQPAGPIIRRSEV